MSKSPLHLVWFKKDLRVDDHAPLAAAMKAGNALALYVYEPSLIAADEYDTSHHVFLNQCLADLSALLKDLGVPLITRIGELPAVFDDIRATHGIAGLYSHRETGHNLSYKRDLRVKEYCQEFNILWQEFSQNGVIRRLGSRDGWAARWTARMSDPIVKTPTRSQTFTGELKTSGLVDADTFGKPRITTKVLQLGGSRSAVETLSSFFELRGRNYATEMSSPVTAGDSCSRMSTHLAYGTISMRQIYHQLLHYLALADDSPTAASKVTKKSLRAFEARLRWHCHFMQKLEDAPQLEFKNMVSSYDGLRDELTHPQFLEAWSKGETGYPMIDACMRALLETSWINFRMRAMLVSFASYDLWLPWQLTARHLAKHFLDFEPGIHYSQVQMQSGTTGINTIRIYNPTKQLLDHDPDGIFVKKHLPELSMVPKEYLAEPWTMPKALQKSIGCIIGKNYPEPLVDHATAVKTARQKLSAVKRTTAAKAEAKEVLAKHGSRKRPNRKKSYNEED